MERTAHQRLAQGNLVYCVFIDGCNDSSFSVYSSSEPTMVMAFVPMIEKWKFKL